MEHFLALISEKLQIFKHILYTNIKKSLFRTAVKSAIRDYVGSRENQIHPFILESLTLVQTKVKVSIHSEENHKNQLGSLFTKYGSDKDTRHSYSWVYSQLLNNLEAPKILEIGVGSRNSFAYGGLPPGGSLKAWREGFPKAYLIGADIDPQAILEIDEPGFVVDQLDQGSLENLALELNKHGKFDLIVDDGFHEPHANLRTYLSLRKCLEDGGFYVIEDVHESLIDFWRVIGELLPDSLEILDLRKQRLGIEDNVLLVFKKI